MSKLTHIFGELTFNEKVMREKLSKEVYEKMRDTIQKRKALDQSIAVDVAHAMKEWAIENGATHFTHWFQPLRGGTAEKHDTFLNINEKDEGVVERFSASQLIQSEPGASSFPSGGMRCTFEARGYTAWDPSTPAFLHEAEHTRTLVIPSVFLSWTGDVLDSKTPFLRSLKAVNDSAIKLQRLLGNRTAKRIKVFAGPEQEYFLFSKDLCRSRPDLRICGRTLFGADPDKGQQMENHYFGAIRPKVIKFMEDFDTELFRRGIPAKTRHNEVSPNQFEIACIHEEANLAIDHNLQLMDILNNVAERHGLLAILHEKPLSGINGSGKHLNWSIGDNTGANYLEPSRSPLKNIIFLLTIGAIMIGIHKYGSLLRASVADAGNDHRLGADEAPPAIISIYLGEYLNSILDEIEGIGKLTEKKLANINLGVQNLPRVAKDVSDRNRTSPLAFTGNKFEFRAVGSSHNCAESAMILNLVAAYGYDRITRKLKSAKKGNVRESAILVLRDLLKETRVIQFEGDNYSKEWQKEAEKRNLSNDINTPAALKRIASKEAIELFGRYNIHSERELQSKVEIKLEAYINIKKVEFKTAINMAGTLILPALAEYLGIISSAAIKVKAVTAKDSAMISDVKFLDNLYTDIKRGIEDLKNRLAECEGEEDLFSKAHLLAEGGEDALLRLRKFVDASESLIADKLWPITKYQDLLIAL